MNARTLSTALTLLVTGTAAATAQQVPAMPAATIDSAQAVDRIQRIVEAMAAADSIEGRREAIMTRLREIGLDPQLEWFDPPPSARGAYRGANIIATIPGPGDSTILLGAHYDRVSSGRGVIDNAAGVATVLELAQAFARQPLRNYRVAVALWDLEERGLLGARAHVADSLTTPLPAVYLNFDIFGYGNAFWVGTKEADAPWPRAMSEAARRAGMPITVDSMYPPSDHIAFQGTRARSHAVSLLDTLDVTIILDAFRTSGMIRTDSTGQTPRVLRIIHSDNDTVDQLDAGAMARGVRVVEEAIRAFDAARRNR